MILKYNKALLPNAQALRRDMTPEERHLWYDFLKKLPVTVNRQKSIGNYIVDFYISSAKIVIELDGIQHRCKQSLEVDKKRDAYLTNLGITVLRYPNETVNKQFNYVCNDISRNIEIKRSSI